MLCRVIVPFEPFRRWRVGGQTRYGNGTSVLTKGEAVMVAISIARTFLDAAAGSEVVPLGTTQG